MVIPHLVHLLLDFMIAVLQSRPWHMAADSRSTLPGMGGTDATGKRSALRCGIGGWYCPNEVDKGNAIWFMYEFCPDELPWAFDRDEDSSRRISALELLGTAVYVKMIIHWLRSRTHRSGSKPLALGVTIPGSTDNPAHHQSFTSVGG